MTESPVPVRIERCSAPLSPELLAQLAAVQASAYAETGLRAWSASEIEAMARTEANSIWIARTEAGVVVGFVMVAIVGPECEILALSVDPARRREKIALKLFDRIAEHFRDSRIDRIILEVAVTNDTAISFYSFLRFYQIGIRRDYYHISGHRIDAKIMEKRFD